MLNIKKFLILKFFYVLVNFCVKGYSFTPLYFSFLKYFKNIFIVIRKKYFEFHSFYKSIQFSHISYK